MGPLVCQSQHFKRDTPERYPWHEVDSIVASGAGSRIAAAIEENLHTEDRRLVPGLRLALAILAEHTPER
jgi:hypothetical protein